MEPASNTRAVAKAQGVSEWTVRQWAATGRIPVMRAGPTGRLMFDLKAVREALTANPQPVPQTTEPQVTK